VPVGSSASTSAGVAMRPLATTDWMRSLRTAWWVSTGLPRIRFRSRNPATASASAIATRASASGVAVKGKFQSLAVLRCSLVLET
jgi:hypothetical protein